MLNFTSDEETDRLISARLASSVPLPGEIAFSNPEDAKLMFRRRAFYAVMGVSDHLLVRFLEGFEIQRTMAAEISRAKYLDRLSHYAAWISPSEPVETYISDGRTERRADRRRTVGGRDPSEPPSSPGPPHTPIPHGRRQAAPNKGRAGARTHVQARRPSFRGGAIGDGAASPDEQEQGASETSPDLP